MAVTKADCNALYLALLLTRTGHALTSRTSPLLDLSRWPQGDAAIRYSLSARDA